MAKSTKYKYVYQRTTGKASQIGTWKAQVFGRSTKSGFETEEEAAKWVDLQHIREGKDPVNGFYTRKE